jgi:hypothetical protein
MRYLHGQARSVRFLLVTQQTKGASMRFRIAHVVIMVLALSAAAAIGLVGATGIASAATPGKTVYTCSGGDFASGHFTSIPSGNYDRISVTGVCNIVPGAVINVAGNIDVAPGAVLDAQSASSTITVGHNITAGAGSLLGLGCQPTNTIGMFAGVPCSDDPLQTTITVNGYITATNADTVLIRKVTVAGNVTLTGGGGEIPWSIKGNTIGGNLTISDVTPDWLGVLFSNVGGNVNLSNITAQDPDDVGFGAAVSVFTNTVGKNLNCSNLGPRLTGGQSNSVGHKATGQCVGMVASA